MPLVRMAVLTSFFDGTRRSRLTTRPSGSFTDLAAAEEYAKRTFDPRDPEAVEAIVICASERRTFWPSTRYITVSTTGCSPSRTRTRTDPIPIAGKWIVPTGLTGAVQVGGRPRS